MNINIVAVGSIKEKYLKDGIREFSKRLSRYCKLKIISVKDEKAPERLSDKQRDMVKTKEGERLLQKIPGGSFVIVLDIYGKSLNSEELAEKIDGLILQGKSQITFIIGGSLGLSDEVLKRSHLLLSFSKMTFPHQLMQLILLEQIYRAFKIIKGETYHK